MEHAGFWERLVAAIIDTLALTLFGILFGLFLAFCAHFLGIDFESRGVELMLKIFGAL